MQKVGFEIIPFDKVCEDSFILVGSRYKNEVLENNNKSAFNYLPLKDVCEIIAGQSPKGEYYNKNGDGLPFYQGNANFGNIY